MDGELGPSWISAGGGGLGSLGELGMAISAARTGCDRGSNGDELSVRSPLLVVYPQ